jgi:hypothetical protein
MAHPSENTTAKPEIQHQPTTLRQLANQISETETDTDAEKVKDKMLKMFCSWNV